MLIGEREQKTNERFRNLDDFESCIYFLDVHYDSEDTVFTRWINKLNTPDFSKINRCQDYKGTVFRQDIVEYTGNNSYTLTSGKCFRKHNNYLTGKDYFDEFSTTNGDEKRGFYLMTSARAQTFCKKHNKKKVFLTVQE